MTGPITDPGIYDMADADYQGDPCETPSLRSSTAWLLHDRTPAHAWYSCSRLNPDYKPENKRFFDIGKAAHTLLLGRGSDYAIVHEDSYRKRDAKDMREQIIAAGKTPLLEKDALQVRAMAKAATRQIQDMIDAGTIASSPFDAAKSEQVIIWRDHGVLCRAMLDGLSIEEDAISEYKTEGTSAAPNEWQYRARKLGYIFRLAFYRRGLEALKIAYSPTIRVFVQEKEPPYLLAMYRIDDELIARADEQVVASIKLWRRCLETNKWPGYSNEGYDISLLDRERAQEAQAAPQAEHMGSEDIAAGVSKATPLAAMRVKR